MLENYVIDLNKLLDKWLSIIIDAFKVSIQELILCYRTDKFFSYELWHKELGCLSAARVIYDINNGLISLKPYCSDSKGPYLHT